MCDEVWREIESGEVWAVQLEGSHIVGCRGPLHPSEARPSWTPVLDPPVAEELVVLAESVA